MQKVSKQSLAMIALSILLAISIALTFTFAALSASKTATGTITFSGGVGLIYEGVTDAPNVSFTITYDGDGKVTVGGLDTVTLKMATTSKKADVNAVIKYYAGETEVTSGDALTALQKHVSLSATSWEGKVAGSEVAKLSGVISATDITGADDYSAIVDAQQVINKIVVTFTATEAN